MSLTCYGPLKGQRDNCDSRANNKMTYECLLSYTQALFVGNSYLFKKNPKQRGKARNQQSGIKATGFDNCTQLTVKINF